MKKVSIVSIGNELMSGRILDSNVAYLSNKLLSVGVETVCTYTVGDDVDMIVDMLAQARPIGSLVFDPKGGVSCLRCIFRADWSQWLHGPECSPECRRQQQDREQSKQSCRQGRGYPFGLCLNGTQRFSTSHEGLHLVSSFRIGNGS